MEEIRNDGCVNNSSNLKDQVKINNTKEYNFENLEVDEFIDYDDNDYFGEVIDNDDDDDDEDDDEDDKTKVSKNSDLIDFSEKI